MVAAVAALDRFAAGRWMGHRRLDGSCRSLVRGHASVGRPVDGPGRPASRPTRRRALPRQPDGTPPASSGSSAREQRAVPTAEVDGAIVDVRCADGCVTDVAPSVPAADVVVDADGGALLPGLHDHHIHLFALAAARASIDLASAHDGGRSRRGRPRRRSDRRADRGCASSAITSRSTGRSIATASICWRQRVASACSTARGRCGCSTRLVWSSSGRSTATVSSEGWTASRPGGCTGWTTSCDERIELESVDLAAAGRELAAHGVTGVTDLTPTEDPAVVDALAEHALAPEFPLRVTITGAPALPASAGRGLAAWAREDHRRRSPAADARRS